MRRLYLEEYLGERGYDVYDLYKVDYARDATAREWLRDHGYDPERSSIQKITDPQGRQAFNDAAINACLRLWMESLGQSGKASEEEIVCRKLKP